MRSLNIKSLILTSVCICLAVSLLTGCKKLLGLPRQENREHITNTIDPHVYMSAFDYLKSRSLGTSAFKDSVFYRMYQAVLYSGIDIEEYNKPDRTYIFLHNDAILRKSGTTTTTDSYFGKYKVNNAAATKWEDYPKDQVKNYLLSLIVKGEHTFETVGTVVKYENSLLPLGSDTLNPESVITFNVVNDVDSRFRVNNFPGSALPNGIQARTAGILSTNGPIHVLDRVLYYQKQ